MVVEGRSTGYVRIGNDGTSARFFPLPSVSFHGLPRHSWVHLPDNIQQHD